MPEPKSHRSPGEGSINRRKDGRWQASLQVAGRRRTVYGRTRKEAARRLDALKREVASSGALSDPGRRTVNDLLDAWLETVAPTLRPRTIHDYRLTCEKSLRPEVGALRLERLTA